MQPLQRWLLAGPILVLASLSVCGCAVGVLASRRDPWPSTSTDPQSNAPRYPSPTRTQSGYPAGEWAALGRVLAAHDYLHRRPGDLLARPWSFTTACREGAGCRTRFTRMTDVGRSTTFLVPHHGYFTADFPPVSTRCLGPGGHGIAPGAPGRMHSHYRLWWSAARKRLIAAERSVSHDRCVPARSRTRWTAVPGTIHMVG